MWLQEEQQVAQGAVLQQFSSQHAYGSHHSGHLSSSANPASASSIFLQVLLPIPEIYAFFRFLLPIPSC
jgi:hypothetical protein